MKNAAASVATLFLLLSTAAPAAEPAPGLDALRRMSARFAPTMLKVDTSRLSAGDRKALAKLVEAARVVNDLYLEQAWSGNEALLASLRKDRSPLGRARFSAFWRHKGPWSGLDDDAAFLPGVPPKRPAGAAFYPEDLTKEEFESWAKGLGEAERRSAEGFFTVIRRNPDRSLRAVPYREAYGEKLSVLARLLREAASLTDNASLKRFLSLRADAVLSDDYYASDVAWMDLDAPIDVTIGPYETYTDGLFGYKAAFEAFVCLKDEAESKKVAFFSEHLQEIEDHLPVDPTYRNPKLGALAPIRVVNEIFAAGDADHGVTTAAFNLPNDERVTLEKGTKRVMLKNVQRAKFEKTLVPISKKALPRAAQKELSFDLFFTHILAHELTHGLGPHKTTVDGRETTPRQALKELYATIEEAKADVTGLFALQYLMDRGPASAGALPKGPLAKRRLYTTFLASAFRTLRFGLGEAHSKGMALQVNSFLQQGAFVVRPDGTFAVDFAKIEGAVEALVRELLTIEATGDYAAAKRLLEERGGIRPEVKRVLDRLGAVPVDIEPLFVTAIQIAPPKG